MSSSVSVPAQITAALNDYCWEAPVITPLPKPTGWTLAKGQVVFRHGARTPAADRAAAFGMVDSIEWHCPIDDNGGANIFAPNNDALKLRMFENSAHDARRNFLSGSCELGQLLGRGYDQEIANGSAIYSMYGGETALLARHTAGTLISLRSTDKDRTKASAMGVLDGFYSDFVADVSTACDDNKCDVRFLTMDYDHETMVPKFGKMCKEQDAALARIEGTEEYLAINTANQALITQLDALDENVDSGSIWPVGVLDMLKTHLCEDKADQLPTGLNTTTDLATNTTLVVDTLTAVDVEENYKYAANGGELSKLVVGRLATEITAKMIYGALDASTCIDVSGTIDPTCAESLGLTPAIYEQYMPALTEIQTNAGSNNAGAEALLSLYSGHDTTVTPLIIALGGWDDIYSRYGATVSVDTYVKCAAGGTFPSCTTNSSGNDIEAAFRVTYNHQDVTGEVFGSSCYGLDSPCPLQKWFFGVESWATYDITKDQCTEAAPSPVDPVDPEAPQYDFDAAFAEQKKAIEDISVGSSGMITAAMVFGLLAFISAALGAFCVMKVKKQTKVLANAEVTYIDA